MNSKLSFLVQELETIDTWKQFSLLVSHSEYNDAEKRYLIFDSTQPFFPHGRILEISEFCLPYISTYMNREFDL